ncbi:MAG: DUF1730 domain-containing protein [Erysipelotrichales bacterium]
MNKLKLDNILKEVGFDIIGYSKPILLEEYTKNIENRISNDMFYYRNNYDFSNYSNAFSVVEDAKTIISVGISYHQKNALCINNDVGYSKSSYGIDYHTLMYTKLSKVIDKLKEEYNNFEYYLNCDTKALDDRYFAYICGNGFYGKNTMIINEEYGSEVFYGTIVLDIDFDIEEASIVESKCGACNRCEVACPMSCLSDYQIDIKHCLSNKTQSKDMLSSDKLGKNIYGCDICNNACPYNKDIEATSYFIDEGTFDAKTLLLLSNAQYKEIFGDKSMSWLNKNIIKKNVILNLPNIYSREEIIKIKDEMIVESKLLEDAFKYILEEE